MLVQSNLEGMIASSLKLRGHNVKMVLCDGVFKACAKRVDRKDVGISDWGKFCPGCIKVNSELLDRIGLDYVYISQLVTDEEIKALRKIADEVTFDNYKDLKLDGIDLGTHISSAMMRHTRGGSYEGHENILKEYAYTVIIISQASKAAIKTFNPTRVYMSHGIYADWGPALGVALKYEIPVVSYICCYLSNHFYYGTVKKKNDTFTGISRNSWKKFEGKKLNEKQMNRLNSFLDRRYLHNVTGDMKGLLKDFKGDKDFFCKEYELDKEKPVWGVLTHINWDAVSDYFPMLYPDFDAWLYDTVKTIKDITDVQWLIKIHPSEKVDNPETGCQKFIENNFPDLPDHIKVVKMDDDISPMDFYGLLDGAVTVMGTGGLEISLKGKPVILAGEAHYSGKGFTYDAKDKEHYRELLHNTKNIKSLDEKMKTNAQIYAYIYFILKQIPLPQAVNEDLMIDFNKINKLYPGKNKFLDFICERIVDGDDFILTDDMMEDTKVDEKEQIRQFA